MENKLNEINRVYTGKNIAQYLNITVPEVPQKWKKINLIKEIGYAIYDSIEKLHLDYLDFLNRKKYKINKELEKEMEKKYVEQKKQDGLHKEKEKTEIGFEEKLRASGIITEIEKDAYNIAHFTGVFMSDIISYYVDENSDGVEVIKRKKGMAEEIRVTPEVFEDYLETSVDKGIETLMMKYRITLNNYIETVKIVNPDFHGKATSWLKEQVYSKTDNGKECKLLEKIVVKREDNGRFNLRTFYESN